MSAKPRTRVLVCDDQALIRAGYITILSSQPDFEIVGTAEDGREAVRLAERLTPDIVIMDIRMPLLDGIEATRRIAGPQSAGRVKVLVVTTFNLDEYVFQALRAGASGFLLKDTPAGEMLAGIRTIAAGNALLAPEVTRRLIGRFGERIRDDDEADRRVREALADLTEREVEVLKLMATGQSNAEIAKSLFLSRETVKTYVSRIFAKLDLRDRVHAVVFAHQIGLATQDG
ncbi:response regulator transcription factor [Actinoallomurus spadix]|uniref:Response regulator transcription factor n=1 Tax=Actinoallomurus spadix TaxID=79912 RepID=A0ABP3GLY4_9ACTN|nr:response regulator transcription factor [Actinoallomurus spadix]MCO5986662.1 response regulator transcription factor [Actinoallomurus spadix]